MIDVVLEPPPEIVVAPQYAQPVTPVAVPSACPGPPRPIASVASAWFGLRVADLNA
jgi:hypothetical protein